MFDRIDSEEAGTIILFLDDCLNQDSASGELEGVAIRNNYLCRLFLCHLAPLVVIIVLPGVISNIPARDKSWDNVLMFIQG